MYEVNTVQSQTEKSDSGNYFVRGPTAATWKSGMLLFDDLAING